MAGADEAVLLGQGGRRAARVAAGAERIARAAPWPILLLTAVAAALRMATVAGAAGDPLYAGAVRGAAGSLSGFLFAAFDPVRVVVADKPLPDLWSQAIGVRLLGPGTAGLALSEVIAGTLAVPLLYDAVRRGAGRAAGLGAAAVLALSPEPVLATRTADAVRLLLLTLALWAAVRGCHARRPRPARGAIVLAGGALGVAFTAQLVEGSMALLPLAILVLLGSRQRPRRRVADAGLAGLALAAAALAWPVLITVLPHSRPWASGSSTGALWGDVLGLNGVGPPTGLPQGPHLSRLLAASGWHLDRLFGSSLVSSLAVGAIAVVLAAAAAWVVRALRDRRIDAGTAALVGDPDPDPDSDLPPDLTVPPDTAPRGRSAAALAVWAVVSVLAGGITYATAGTGHVRYLELMSAALATIVGLGAAGLAGFDGSGTARRRPASLPITLALAGVCAYAFHFRLPSTSWASLALLMAAVGGALLATTPAWRGPARWLVAGLVVACTLVVPVHVTFALVRAGAGAAAGQTAGAPANAWALAGHLEAPMAVNPLAAAHIVPVRVSGDLVGPAMPRGFVGLSLEYGAVPAYAGRRPNDIDPVFLTLLRGISPGGATQIRIGGDSTDHTWWPVRGLSPPPGVTYSLTDRWLAVTRALARRLGAHLILGVNLAADRPGLAAAEARALLGGIGRRHVEALEIGNEPDIYNAFAWYRAADGSVHYARPLGYDLGRYIADFNRWRRALPVAPLAGPAFAEPTWMTRLSSFLARVGGLRLVTLHRYPTHGCGTNATLETQATIPNLMSDAASAGLAQQVAPYAATAHAAGLPLRLDEMNSASCAGKAGVSDTFASALWVVDTLFNMAAAGVNGVNVHTLPGAVYQPFSFTRSGGAWTARVAPLYYGMLMFARAFPPGARLVSLAAPAGPVKAWATAAPDGHLRVVLINKDPARSVMVRLRLPGPPAPLTEEALRAPSLAATGGVTLGGESFGADTTTGVLPENPQPPRVMPLLGGYSIPLPAASAILLSR